MSGLLKRRRLVFGVSAALAPIRAKAGATEVLVYPRPGGRLDAMSGYVPDLLRLALERSGRRATLRESTVNMAQSRVVLEMQRPNPPVDVWWTVTTKQRQGSLLAVRIPIERGLIGWRVALVRRLDADKWREVRVLAQLAPYSAGQKHDWPDTAILRRNGLNVQTAGRYESLFSMLAAGRIDYFPRSVLEINAELQSHAELDLVIEPHVCLHYPSAMYFFVPQSRIDLAGDIRTGLELAQADGSFEQLFQKRFRNSLDLLHLKERRILELQNHDLPEDAQLRRHELWMMHS